MVHSQFLAAPYLFGFIGNGLTRGIALALPSAKVWKLLPPGLELGDQHVTPPGTHPLIFLCHHFSECQFSFPNPLRSMNFHEQTVGIPFTLLCEGPPGERGPYYFMPKLYLDDLWVWMNGTYWWGFDKEMAIIEESSSRYTVTSANARRLLSLEWTPRGRSDHASIGYAGFAPIREMLSQTLVSVCPAAVGPFFSLTDFDRRWSLATVRQNDSILDMAPEYAHGLEGGRFIDSGRLEGEGSGVLGSFEIAGPWWLSLPYRTTLSTRRWAGATSPCYS